jgi:hypothetical protein
VTPAGRALATMLGIAVVMTEAMPPVPVVAEAADAAAAAEADAVAMAVAEAAAEAATFDAAAASRTPLVSTAPYPRQRYPTLRTVSSRSDSSPPILARMRRTCTSTVRDPP